MSIYSLQLEKYLLSALIKHQDSFADIESFITENDFVNDVHYTIFCVYKDTFNKGETIDKVLIAQKAKNLGITFKDQSVDIFNYVNSILANGINYQRAVQAYVGHHSRAMNLFLYTFIPFK